MFFDDEENLYLACNSRIPDSEKSTCQYGRLLRIKKGELDFDKSYEGYKNYTGKLVTVDYVGNNKAILYIQDPQHTGTSSNNALYAGWGDDYITVRNCLTAAEHSHSVLLLQPIKFILESIRKHQNLVYISTISKQVKQKKA